MLTSPLFGYKTFTVSKLKKICSNTTLWIYLFILNSIIITIFLLSLKHSNQKIGKLACGSNKMKHETTTLNLSLTIKVTQIINLKKVMTSDTNKQQQLSLTTLVTTGFIKLALETAEDINYKKVVNKEETFQEIAVKRINNVESVKMENSDELPKISYFGIKNKFDICVSADEKHCSPKFQRSRTLFTFVPATKLLACAITKNMSTVLRAIMCYLYDPKKFIAASRLLHRELMGGRFCEGNYFYVDQMNEYISHHFKQTTDDVMATWRPFVFVRDPVDRFLSAFIDKCIRRRIDNLDSCNSCGQNMTCFIISEYGRIMHSYGWNSDSYEDQHFFPQNWECTFRRYIDKFQFVQYNSADPQTVVDQFTVILQDRGIDQQQIDYICNSLKTNRTLHTTRTSKTRIFFENRLRSSPFLMEFIIRMYYWDFKLFNYTLPIINF